MENKKRRNFTDEYKQDVIRMHEEQSIPIRRLSIDLEISEVLLYNWRRKFGRKQERAKNTELTNIAEIKKLTKRLREVEEERDILKKAMAIFTQPAKPGINS